MGPHFWHKFSSDPKTVQTRLANGYAFRSHPSKMATYSIAIFVAVWFGIWRWDQPWIRFWNFVLLIWSGLRGKKAPLEVVERRNAACAACPVYYPPLGTCGTPLDKQWEGLGCHCVCELKNRLANASCWAKDMGIRNYGWPDNLCETKTT